MSAGICIMNQNAIALAADSAVTVDGGKAIHNSVNKLFSLSRFEPIGALIYSNASFMNTPVEIILKQYREYLDTNKKYCDYLEEYMKEFFSYLKSNSDLFRFEINEKNFVLRSVISLLDMVDASIKTRHRRKIESLGRDLTKDEYNDLYEEIVKLTELFVKRQKDLTNFNQKSYVESKYRTDIESYIRNRYTIFEESELTTLIESSVNIICKDYWKGGYVGIAIAGYGKKEIYPSMVHVHLSGYLNGELKYKIVKTQKIDENHRQYMTPLAQVDVMETFLYGLNTNLLNNIGRMISETLGDDIDCLCDAMFSAGQKEHVKKELEASTKHIVDKIINEMRREYSDPIYSSIGSLPMDELAMLAESMINLTSLRRQVAIDANSRTVGGPIDVAIISKGDGFIWTKRKHYFDGKINPQYYYRNFGG